MICCQPTAPMVQWLWTSPLPRNFEGLYPLLSLSSEGGRWVLMTPYFLYIFMHLVCMWMYVYLFLVTVAGWIQVVTVIKRKICWFSTSFCIAVCAVCAVCADEQCLAFPLSRKHLEIPAHLQVEVPQTLAYTYCTNCDDEELAENQQCFLLTANQCVQCVQMNNVWLSHWAMSTWTSLLI